MLLQHCAVWLLAALGYGPIAAAAALLLVRAVVTPTVAVLLVHRHSWLHYGFEHARLTELRSLAKPAIANVGFPLAQSLNIQGMVLVVGAALGPLAVVTFSALRTLTRVALQAVLTVSHAAEPELAVAYGAGNNALLKRLYEQIARMGMWLAVLAALGLSFFGDWIVDTWTHGHVTMNTALFNWLLATSVSGALWYSSLTVLKGANLHLRAIYVYAVTAALAVVIAYVTMVKTGWIEMAGATLLLIDGAMVAYTLQAAGRICGTTTWRLLLHVMNPLPLLLQYKKRADAA
jgi:O-antigen/teichoic acid export membrane protein